MECLPYRGVHLTLVSSLRGVHFTGVSILSGFPPEEGCVLQWFLSYKGVCHALVSTFRECPT